MKIQVPVYSTNKYYYNYVHLLSLSRSSHLQSFPSHSQGSLVGVVSPDEAASMGKHTALYATDFRQLVVPQATPVGRERESVM